jgi:hypothetical protein
MPKLRDPRHPPMSPPRRGHRAWSDVSAAATVPGRPNMLDHILLVTFLNGTNEELHRLVQWIRHALLGKPDRPGYNA